MAYSITTQDGITIQNIPDEVASDSQELKDRVATIRAGRGAGGATSLNPPTEGDQFARRLGLTLRAGVQGAAGTIGMFTDPIAATLNTVLPEGHKINNLNNLRTAVHGILTQLGVPEPQNAVERIVNAAGELVIGTAGGIGAGKALAKAVSPVVSGIGEFLASQPAQQLSGALVGGIAGQAATEAGAPPAVQAAASLAGGVVGAGAAGLHTAPRGAKPEILKQAENAGVDVLTSDIAPPGTFAGRYAQATAEKIPVVGTGGLRKGQQLQRIDAVRNVLRDFGADTTAQLPDEVMKDLFAKRSTDLTKYVGMKGEVIARLDKAGSTVPVPKASAEIDRQLAGLRSLNTPAVNPIIKELENFKGAIQDQRLGNVEELRKQLGEAFKEPDLVSVRGRGEKVVSQVYGALREDMGTFIKQEGERRDFTKWAVANSRLKDMMGELEMGALKSVLSKGDVTPEVVSNMLLSKKPSEVNALYSGLTPAGRASGRAAILQAAASKSGVSLENGMEYVSPEKFKAEMKRLSPSINAFFKGDDKAQLDGLVRVLDLTKRAAEAPLAPATGVQMAPPVILAALVDIFGGSKGAAIATLGAAGGMARIYESAPVRNLMMKLPQVVRGSPEEAALFKRIMATVQSQKQKEQ